MARSRGRRIRKMFPCFHNGGKFIYEIASSHCYEKICLTFIKGNETLNQPLHRAPTGGVMHLFDQNW